MKAHRDTLVDVSKLLSDEKGYSTIEVIMTILFLAVTLPAIIELFSASMLKSAESRLMENAIVLCEEKIEIIITDKLSRSRGYSWITDVNRYPNENMGQGFTRTTTVETAGKNLNGVAYAEISVTVTHDMMKPVQVKTWLTRY